MAIVGIAMSYNVVGGGRGGGAETRYKSTMTSSTHNIVRQVSSLLFPPLRGNRPQLSG